MKQHFAGTRKIEFEGPGTRNPLAFRWYNPDELVSVKAESDMLKYRNFGRKSLNEIKFKLSELGLSRGMTLDP